MVMKELAILVFVVLRSRGVILRLDEVGSRGFVLAGSHGMDNNKGEPCKYHIFPRGPRVRRTHLVDAKGRPRETESSKIAGTNGLTIAQFSNRRLRPATPAGPRS